MLALFCSCTKQKHQIEHDLSTSNRNEERKGTLQDIADITKETTRIVANSTKKIYHQAQSVVGEISDVAKEMTDRILQKKPKIKSEATTLLKTRPYKSHDTINLTLSETRLIRSLPFNLSKEFENEFSIHTVHTKQKLETLLLQNPILNRFLAKESIKAPLMIALYPNSRNVIDFDITNLKYSSIELELSIGVFECSHKSIKKSDFLLQIIEVEAQTIEWQKAVLDSANAYQRCMSPGSLSKDLGEKISPDSISSQLSKVIPGHIEPKVQIFEYGAKWFKFVSKYCQECSELSDNLMRSNRYVSIVSKTPLYHYKASTKQHLIVDSIWQKHSQMFIKLKHKIALCEETAKNTEFSSLLSVVLVEKDAIKYPIQLLTPMQLVSKPRFTNCIKH